MPGLPSQLGYPVFPTITPTQLPGQSVIQTPTTTDRRRPRGSSKNDACEYCGKVKKYWSFGLIFWTRLEKINSIVKAEGFMTLQNVKNKSVLISIRRVWNE